MKTSRKYLIATALSIFVFIALLTVASRIYMTDSIPYVPVRTPAAATRAAVIDRRNFRAHVCCAILSYSPIAESLILRKRPAVQFKLFEKFSR